VTGGGTSAASALAINTSSTSANKRGGNSINHDRDGENVLYGTAMLNSSRRNAASVG